MDPSLAAGIVFILGLAAAVIIYIRSYIQPARKAGIPDWLIAIRMRYSPLAVIALVVIILVLSVVAYLLHLVTG